MTTRFDLSLPHSYGARLARLPPGNTGQRVHYYPGGDTKGGRDGVLIEVTPISSEPWFGMFADGYDSPPACSGVFASPHPDRICVISKGLAIEVDTTSPKHWRELPAFPVTHVLPAPEIHALLLCNFCSVIAWSADGPRWKTDLSLIDGYRIPMDGFSRVALQGEVLRGVRSVPESFPEDFALDIRTGRSL